jgi:hypothetical protein
MRTGPILLSVAVVLGAACGDQGPTPVPGTYVLESVDGQRSPFWAVVSYGQGTVDGQPVLVETLDEFVGDTLRLRGDGTLERVGLYRHTVRAFSPTGAVVDSSTTLRSLTGTGTYTATGGSVALTDDNGLVWTGTLDRGVLTLVTERSDAEWVYRRRR